MKVQSILFSSGFALLFTVSSVTQAQSFEVDAYGLPILNSNPNAIGAAYIDFDGGTWQGTVRRAYSTDTDDTTFNTSEQQDIYNAWLDVSAHFAMFDINVTTVAPNKSRTPTAHVLVTPDMSNAAANVNFFGEIASTARGAAQSSYARTRATAITHELGHIMGLLHQSEYDAAGTMIRSYRGADEWNIAPIMGVDYAGKFSSWQDGFTGANMTPQDDIGFMTSKITSVYNNFTNGSYAGDGFRTDEHGNSFADATVLVAAPKGNGNGNGKGGGGGGTDKPGGGKGKNKTTLTVEQAAVNITTSGIIERYSDIDMFSIVWEGGDMYLVAEALKNVASRPVYASSLGMNMLLYDATGAVIGEDLSLDPADVDASLAMTGLGAGTYYVGVSSAGGYDDLGGYSLSLSNQSFLTSALFAAAVPEPSSLLMLGFAGLFVMRRRRA